MKPSQSIAIRFIGGLYGRDTASKTKTDGTSIFLNGNEILRKVMGGGYYFSLGGAPSPMACSRINAVLSVLQSSWGVLIHKGEPVVSDPGGNYSAPISCSEWYFITETGEIPWPLITKKDQENTAAQIPIKK